MVYVYATVLLIANVLAWATTMLMGPGNWLIVLFSGLYVYLLPEELTPRMGWQVVGGLVALAVLGEVIEFFAGAAGAARQGGTRRGAVFSMIGAFVGTIAGAVIGVPVPVIGSVIAAIVGGGVGAFVGAYIGERDQLHRDRVAIGKGALWGRLLGTAGKLVVGASMLALATVGSFF